MKGIIRRFRQFEGWRLVMTYARMGLLGVIVKEMARCIIQKRSLKSIYPTISQRIDPFLVDKYHHLFDKHKHTQFSTERNVNANGKTYVWTCWLQGWDKAPRLAKACLASLRRNLTDAEIIQLDENNYTEWVTLPDYIVGKYRRGYIPPALFSDMLRLQLLIVHGGVWIDSTTLHTPYPSSAHATRHNPSWQSIVDADLFVFQYTGPDQKWTGSISNWFIASKKGNPFLMSLQDILYAYWKDYDVALEYYIFHLFFKELARTYPEQIAAMPYGSSSASISLAEHLNMEFNNEKWTKVTSQVFWHKMNYRKEKEYAQNHGNYYSHIIEEYRC